MKKTLIALLVSGLCATAVQAAGQDGTWYAGGKMGYSTFTNISKTDALTGNALYVTGDDTADLGWGVFGGYQYNQNVAFEFGYDDLGTYGVDLNNGNADVSAEMLQATVKLSMPVYNNIDAYTRIGMGYTFAEQANGGADSEGASFVGALGFEYAINLDWAARFEYQYTSDIGDENVTGFQMDNNLISLAAVYRIGQVAPVAAPVEAPVVPQVVEQEFALNSDVLFDFGKATLKPEANAALDALYEQIVAARPKNGEAVVIGHTDRIGNEAYNQKLSEQRAHSVAMYLINKGLPAEKVIAEGRGETAPVTGDSCNGKRGNELIVCFAPDRRVEVKVQGVTEVQQ